MDLNLCHITREEFDEIVTVVFPDAEERQRYVDMYFDTHMNDCMSLFYLLVNAASFFKSQVKEPTYYDTVHKGKKLRKPRNRSY